jgi:hypothetical protein
LREGRQSFQLSFQVFDVSFDTFDYHVDIIDISAGDLTSRLGVEEGI